MKAKLNIWWKLAFASSVIDVLALPVWIGTHYGLLKGLVPVLLTIVLHFLLLIPVAYLIVFSLWHWRTRYAGKNPIAWPILFAMTSWKLFSLMPCSALTALAYCAMHLIPDARGKGAYANPHPPLEVTPPASPLPQDYQLAQSACSTLGWTLIIGGILSAALAYHANFVVWNRFECVLPNQVGTEFTEATSHSLWCCSLIAKTTGITCLASAVAAAFGAVLIYVSQNLRWRMLVKQKKEEP